MSWTSSRCLPWKAELRRDGRPEGPCQPPGVGESAPVACEHAAGVPAFLYAAAGPPPWNGKKKGLDAKTEQPARAAWSNLRWSAWEGRP